MRIYIGDASSFNYQGKLYLPLKNVVFAKDHEFIFPHEKSNTAVYSKSIIASSDLFITEVSFPSTGLGIELGWANDLGCEILCLHRLDSKPSDALNTICSDYIAYQNTNDMIEKLAHHLVSHV